LTSLSFFEPLYFLQLFFGVEYVSFCLSLSKQDVLPPKKKNPNQNKKQKKNFGAPVMGDTCRPVALAFLGPVP